jgi:hypothetical protein
MINDNQPTLLRGQNEVNKTEANELPSFFAGLDRIAVIIMLLIIFTTLLREILN